ncbi:MBL fold metallo-hydrolase [Thermodesulfobacteriota bacterium]
MKQLTTNVYVETQWVSGTHALAGSNSSFVVTSQGIVMIDAPLVPANALKWKHIIEEKGELIYLINTGCHTDHTSGNYFFPVPIIAHEETRKSIPTILDTDEVHRRKLQKYFPFCADLVKDYQIRLPSITFFDRMNLYVGEHTFELIHFPGHSPGEIGVYLPQEKIVFTGDNFANGFQPKLSDCCPLEQLDSLRKILEIDDVEYFVPGHGEVGDKRTVREYMSVIQRYVDEIKEAIHKGMTREEAMDHVQLPIPDSLVYRHPEPEQLRKDIGRLYEMLSKP